MATNDKLDDVFNEESDCDTLEAKQWIKLREERIKVSLYGQQTVTLTLQCLTGTATVLHCQCRDVSRSLVSGSATGGNAACGLETLCSSQCTLQAAGCCHHWSWL